MSPSANTPQERRVPVVTRSSSSSSGRAPHMMESAKGVSARTRCGCEAHCTQEVLCCTRSCHDQDMPPRFPSQAFHPRVPIPGFPSQVPIPGFLFQGSHSRVPVPGFPSLVSIPGFPSLVPIPGFPSQVSQPRFPCGMMQNQPLFFPCAAAVCNLCP